MYPIVRKETSADNIILMDIKAPRVANECLPGQFIIAKTDEVGERIPLTICDYDREKETVTIVVQTIGAGTERMMALKRALLSKISLVLWDVRPNSVRKRTLRRPEKRKLYLSQEVWEPQRYTHR